MSYEDGLKFCIGNQPWKNHNPLSKVGRPRIYEDGEEEKMWTDAQAYFEYVDNNPLVIDDWVGGMAKEVKRVKPLPYSLEGYVLFISASMPWWYGFKARKDLSPEFVIVIRAIEDTIYQQQYDGAAGGLFQHNIVARKLGLAEAAKIDAEIKHAGKVETIDYSKLSDGALKEIIQAGNAEGADSIGHGGEGGTV